MKYLSCVEEFWTFYGNFAFKTVARGWIVFCMRLSYYPDWDIQVSWRPLSSRETLSWSMDPQTYIEGLCMDHDTMIHGIVSLSLSTRHDCHARSLFHPFLSLFTRPKKVSVTLPFVNATHSSFPSFLFLLCSPSGLSLSGSCFSKKYESDFWARA